MRGRSTGLPSEFSACSQRVWVFLIKPGQAWQGKGMAVQPLWGLQQNPGRWAQKVPGDVLLGCRPKHSWEPQSWGAWLEKLCFMIVHTQTFWYECLQIGSSSWGHSKAAMLVIHRHMKDAQLLLLYFMVCSSFPSSEHSVGLWVWYSGK